ncbi:hypothetical protein BTO02_07235 [Paraburkholderia sp. SOS3]|nr:hypothetical protein BTO02_07235 [Paraburkholderia sp. SOS3]
MPVIPASQYVERTQFYRAARKIHEKTRRGPWVGSRRVDEALTMRRCGVSTSEGGEPRTQQNQTRR